MSEAPRIAVVIPTHNRETRLAFALEALAAQSLPAREFEVMVVRDPGAPVLAQAPDGLAVRFLECDHRNVARKRNHGWQAATAPLVAFLDDDCRPAPGWLEGLLAAAEAAGEVVLQGRTEPDPDELHLLYGLARSVRIEAVTPWFEACNIVYRRDLLERLDGFDEGFGLPPFGEDTDLALRALRGGAAAAFADDAVVWHAVHSRSYRQALREASRRQHTGRIIRRYPAYRRHLRNGLFANDAHRGIAIALAGVLLGAALPRGGRVVAAAATVPYLTLAAREWAGSGRITPRRVARMAVHLPVQASLDFVSVAATIGGSVETRTLVV